ncbi:hypothetical protein BKA82DRAFT_4237243 [Pisolithus tinctorius]|nr:hypothetical protein BKA82DRAFT_4237243 [Pisolithus tinctorius]
MLLGVQIVSLTLSNASAPLWHPPTQRDASPQGNIKAVRGGYRRGEHCGRQRRCTTQFILNGTLHAAAYSDILGHSEILARGLRLRVMTLIGRYSQKRWKTRDRP